MTLRRTPGLSRPVLRWVSQVTASLGATLSATLIWSAVPHPGAATQPPPPPELTSGGKFAARAVQPAADDGLDTMPVPRVAPAPPSLALAAFDAAPQRPARRPVWEEAAPAVDRRAPRGPRGSAHAEARRAAPAPSPSAAAPAGDSGAGDHGAGEPAPEEGFLHRVLPSALTALQATLPEVVPGIAATARHAWSATASAGDALVARVAPRMP